jgi:hypothetical protein
MKIASKNCSYSSNISIDTLIRMLPQQQAAFLRTFRASCRKCAPQRPLFAVIRLTQPEKRSSIMMISSQQANGDRSLLQSQQATGASSISKPSARQAATASTCRHQASQARHAK